MNWDEIKEVENSKIGVIGNHSHSHEYLVDLDKDEINQNFDIGIDGLVETGNNNNNNEEE